MDTAMDTATATHTDRAMDTAEEEEGTGVQVSTADILFI